MIFGEKVAKLPRIGNVEDQLCEQKIEKKCQKAVLSDENEAYEKQKVQQFLLVAKALKNLIKYRKMQKNSKTCEKNTEKSTAKKSFKSEI